MDFQIAKTSVLRNPYIGLFLKASNKHVLLPKHSNKQLVELAERTLCTQPLELFVNQSNLLGILIAMNDSGCILPAFAEKSEVDILKKAGYNAVCLEKAFAAGNNILCNNKAALVNPQVPKVEAKKIGETLNVEVFQQPISGFATVGSTNVVTDKGLLACNETTEVELKYLEKIFGVQAAVGSVNMGSVFNSLGVIANAKGALVGENSSGFEVQRVFQALSD